MSEIKIEVLYSEYANLFGDLMNIHYLGKCIPQARIIYTGLNDIPAFTKETVSMIYMGPMTEHQQELVIQALLPYKEQIQNCIANNTVFLLTGNAMETFEAYIENENGSRIMGLNLFPTYAKRDMFHRYNSMILGEFDGMKLIGFKAQFSHSYGDNTKEFFYHVTRGCGIEPHSKLEGLRRNNFFGTYTVGPFLLLNPLFVKYLLQLLGVENPHLAFEETIMEAYQKRLTEFEKEQIKGFTKQIETLQEQIEKLGDLDLRFTTVKELQNRLKEQIEILEREQAELLKLEEEEKKIDQNQRELLSYEEKLCKIEEACKEEQEQLKDAEKQEVEYQFKVEEAKKRLSSFQEQLNIRMNLKQMVEEQKKACEQIEIQIEEQQKQYVCLQKEWETVKDVETHKLKMEQKKQELAKQKEMIWKLKNKKEVWEKQEEELEFMQKEYEKAVKEKEQIGAFYEQMEQGFLDAQAGLLARDLKEGQACPVCGSMHHPVLAKIPETVPDREKIEQEKKRYSQARAKVERLSAEAGHKKEQAIKQKQEVLELAMKWLNQAEIKWEDKKSF